MQFLLFAQLKAYARDYPERLDSLTPDEFEQSLHVGKEDSHGSYDHHRNFCSSSPALHP